VASGVDVTRGHGSYFFLGCIPQPIILILCNGRCLQQYSSSLQTARVDPGA